MNQELKTMIGQRLVGGFPGKEISPEFERLVKEYKIGNVILFRHNVEDGKQLKELCRSIQRLIRKETGHSALITIDQEGGTVTRLPEDACNVPGAMALTATGSPENAKICAKITAHELKAFGINFNLAPSMDINCNPNNPVIGVRSYGETAEQVEAYAGAALDGYMEEGILAVVKHFPGHGDTAVDSHVGLPVINKSLEELEALELRPFRAAIKKGVPAVMSSHILFPKLEAEQIPCTMSRTIITDLLKKTLGFQGIVLSDCMEMDAIRKFYGTAKGVVEAMAAGVDLVFVSHTADLLEKAACAVYEAVEYGRISMKEMKDSYEKIIAVKESLPKEIENISYGEEASMKQAAEIRRKTIALTQGTIQKAGEGTLFVGCRDFRVTQVSNKKGEDTAFSEFMAKRFGGKGIVTGKNPDETEIINVLKQVEKADNIVICTYNGHLFMGQKALVKSVSNVCERVTIVALRNPYDLIGLPSHVTGIAAWDYTEMTLEAVAEILDGQWIPTGRVEFHENGCGN